MKKIILAILVSMMMMSSAYADETIQLAAVMTESNPSPIDANKKIYATSGNQGGGSGGMMSGSTIIVGIVVAGALALTVNGFDSTSNH